jgi:hypothetical protein
MSKFILTATYETPQYNFSSEHVNKYAKALSEELIQFIRNQLDIPLTGYTISFEIIEPKSAGKYSQGGEL